MKNTVLLLISLLPLFCFAQSKTEIQGQILTADGKPAQGITVRLTELNRSVSSNTHGRYIFTNVDQGPYTLSISAMGIQSRDTTVLIQGDQVQLPPLVLIQNREQLEEIVVRGQGNNPFGRTSSPYVAKMPLKNLENPQSYAVVSQELLKSQVNTNFDDALNNVSGLDKLWGSTGRPADGAAYYSFIDTLPARKAKMVSVDVLRTPSTDSVDLRSSCLRRGVRQLARHLPS